MFHHAITFDLETDKPKQRINYSRIKCYGDGNNADTNYKLVLLFSNSRTIPKSVCIYWICFLPSHVDSMSPAYLEKSVNKHISSLKNALKMSRLLNLMFPSTCKHLRFSANFIISKNDKENDNSYCNA